VNLLKLSPLETVTPEIRDSDIVIRRAQPFEIMKVRKFVETNFTVDWADEISVGFSNKPVSIFIATLDKKIVGFAAYECTRRAFFGPMGVVESSRGSGVGRALLLASLWGLRDVGYVYGIIGGAGPIEFYERSVGAIVIPGSEAGIYEDLLE
jgi:predicted N-acetyltransferase YhbS